MTARPLALLIVSLVAGCAGLSGAPVENRTALRYLTRLPPEAALDSVRAWAAGSGVVGAERADGGLALRDLRPGADNAARVTARPRPDGATEVAVSTTYLRTDQPPFRDLGVMVYFGQKGSDRGAHALPVDGSDTCFAASDWLAAAEPLPALPSDAPDVEETAPSLVGGLSGLARRLDYPEAMRRAGVEGEVVTEFVVGEGGTVDCVQAISSPHPALTAAAVEVVQTSRFTPGTRDGRPVRVRFALPITFRLR